MKVISYPTVLVPHPGGFPMWGVAKIKKSPLVRGGSAYFVGPCYKRLSHVTPD